MCLTVHTCGADGVTLALAVARHDPMHKIWQQVDGVRDRFAHKADRQIHGVDPTLDDEDWI